MVTKTGHNYIYDNFKIGVVEVSVPDGAEKFHHISFTEQDFEEDFMNVSHIFKIHEKQMDAYIEILRTVQGKKTVHVATPGEMPR